MSIRAGLVTDAATACREALGPNAGADWTVPAGDLEWSCWYTGVHLADDLAFYASQIIDQPASGYVPFEIAMDDDATPDGLLRTIAVFGVVLERVVAASDSADRGFHVYGTSDAEGFAAMGVVETLVHTYDIAAGLGAPWLPPSDLCTPVIDRLFPDAPGGDPSDVLLWCTGRRGLDDRPRQTGWRWDGTVRA